MYIYTSLTVVAAGFAAVELCNRSKHVPLFLIRTVHVHLISSVKRLQIVCCTSKT